MSKDSINPKHYKTVFEFQHPECIMIADKLDFCLGNAVKYIWRAGEKTEDIKEDLVKSLWYIKHEYEIKEVTAKQLYNAECIWKLVAVPKDDNTIWKYNAITAMLSGYYSEAVRFTTDVLKEIKGNKNANQGNI